jgi:cytoskeletal protein CcmA (bactofilin family)
LSLLIFQGAFWKGWKSMITLLEVLALLTLGGFAVAFFRKRVRRGSALALVLAGFCAALLLQPASAMASDTRRGESVVVASNETIKGDIFLFGERVRVEGTVDGDVFAFGHDVTVTGHVKGDVIAGTHLLEINGQVDGNVRAAGNTLTIRGAVTKNVLTFDEVVNVESSGKIGGSLTIFVENLDLEGTLGRDILIFGKHLTLSGKVGGGVRMKGDTLSINSSAEVDGPIRFEGNHEAEVASGAKLASPVEFHKAERKPEYMEGHYYLWRLIWTAAFILFGVVLFLLIPNFSAETIATAERFGASIGLGVLIFFGVPIAAVIACITVVGMPLGILAVGFWLLMLCSAEIVVGTVVGSWILGKARDASGLIGRMALGFVLVRLIYTGLEQMHVIGLLAGLVIWMWGMGAISLALYQRLQPTIAAGATSGPYTPPLPPNTTVGGMQPA